MHPWINYQTQQWRYILEITRAIAARLDLDSVLDKALRYAVDLVGGAAGLVALRDASGSFHFAARYGLDQRLVSRLDSLLTDIPPAFEQDPAAARRLPELGIRFSGLVDDELLRLENAMALPLVASEHLLGIIYVFRRRGETPFNALDRDALAGFGDHVAIAIENARLYNDAEARARELLAVIEGSSQGVLIADPEGRVRRINRALERLTGWSRAQAIGQDYRRVVALTDERGKALDPLQFDPSFRQGTTAEGFLTRHGGARGAFAHLSLSPLFNESKQVSSLLLNVVDITELRESDEYKTAFLAGISHDLKTP
ncbi:MAG: GAF domain-containing protein, partial [Rudaea sp.]